MEHSEDEDLWAGTWFWVERMAHTKEMRWRDLGMVGSLRGWAHQIIFIEEGGDEAKEVVLGYTKPRHLHYTS